MRVQGFGFGVIIGFIVMGYFKVIGLKQKN